MSGLYRLSIEDRRRELMRRVEVQHDEIGALDWGGLLAADADNLIENVLGTYKLPFAVCPNFLIDGQERVLPMVVEEPSVVAAASNAARIAREGGGFVTEADEPVMIGQVQVLDVPDLPSAIQRIDEAQAELLEMANACHPNLVERGGGARGIEVRTLPEDEHQLVVHILISCCDAMGANLVNTVAERLADRIAGLAGGSPGLRILSNLADRRLVRVTVRIPAHALAIAKIQGEQVRDQIVAASRFAEMDPYRAVTHNKGIMNGVDAVCLAVGNDWRSVEAGAHAYAARSGRYGPLATWRVGDDGHLLGKLEMPMAVGMVGGAIRVHSLARLGLKIASVENSTDLGLVMACAGMASNLAALRALATIGIQRGHMSLHARSVARAAGAKDGQVELVARLLAQSGEIRPENAEAIIKDLGL
jgi:hydroxymethylglutaryl-CoA reductase